MIFDQICKNKQAKIARSKQKSAEFLGAFKDFYMEINWEVQIPFLTSLLPYDNCKLYKVGKNLRFNFTVYDIKKIKVTRYDQSILFQGEIKNTSSKINWDLRSYYDHFSALTVDEKELLIKDLMDGKKLSGEFKLKDYELTPCKSSFKKEIEVKIEGYVSKKYEVTVTMSLGLNNKKRQAYSKYFNDLNYFDQKDNLGEQLELVLENKDLKKKLNKIKNNDIREAIFNGKDIDKRVKAYVWIAKDFPLSVRYFLNLLDSISTANEVLMKVKEFFKNPRVISIIEENGFPIKIQIPFKIIINLVVSFANFRFLTESEIEESLKKIEFPENFIQVSKKEKWDEDEKLRLGYLNFAI